MKKVEKKVEYKVGQTVKNPHSKLLRTVTKVGRDSIAWISKDGLKKGKCSKKAFTRWADGKDAK